MSFGVKTSFNWQLKVSMNMEAQHAGWCIVGFGPDMHSCAPRLLCSFGIARCTHSTLAICFSTCSRGAGTLAGLGVMCMLVHCGCTSRNM